MVLQNDHYNVIRLRQGLVGSASGQGLEAQKPRDRDHTNPTMWHD
jgi:hypothetical protein